MFFRGWFGLGDDEWFDPATVTPAPPSGDGGVSKAKVLGTVAPRPAVPPWRQIAGATGTMFSEVRRFLSDVYNRDHLWGNHVDVTFAGPGTSVRVDTGLGGPSQGYKIVRSNGDLRVWDGTPPSGSDPTPERGIVWLQANAAGKVTLYIY